MPSSERNAACRVRRRLKRKTKLVEIEVLSTQAVIDAQGPDFEIGEDPVGPGQHNMGGHFADDVRIMVDAGGARISRPPIGLGGGAGGEIGLEEGVQALGRVIGHFLEPDAAWTGPAVLHLDGAEDEHFALMTASVATGQG